MKNYISFALLLSALPLIAMAPIQNQTAQTTVQKDTLKELSNAIMTGDLASVRQILDSGIDINARFDYTYSDPSYTPIIYAAMIQNVPIIKEILKHNPDLTTADSFGQTAIHFASYTPNTEVMGAFRDYVAQHPNTVTAQQKAIMGQ